MRRQHHGDFIEGKIIQHSGEDAGLDGNGAGNRLAGEPEIGLDVGVTGSEAPGLKIMLNGQADIAVPEPSIAEVIQHLGGEALPQQVLVAADCLRIIALLVKAVGFLKGRRRLPLLRRGGWGEAKPSQSQEQKAADPPN